MDNSILETLHKLKAKADSLLEVGNQEEAELFAAKVQELLLRYKLTMSDVETAAQDRDDPIEKEVQPPVTKGAKWWALDLAKVVSEAHFCLRFDNRSQPGAISFVGRKSDREVAIYMFIYLVRAMQQLEKEARKLLEKEKNARIAAVYEAITTGKEPPKFDTLLEVTEFTDAFYRGFTTAIKERYEAQKVKLTETYGGTALVVANKAVSTWVQNNMRFSYSGKLYGGGLSNQMGQSAGRQAGQSVELGRRGVSNKGGQRQIT